MRWYNQVFKESTFTNFIEEIQAKYVYLIQIDNLKYNFLPNILIGWVEIFVEFLECEVFHKYWMMANNVKILEQFSW